MCDTLSNSSSVTTTLGTLALVAFGFRALASTTFVPKSVYPHIDRHLTKSLTHITADMLGRAFLTISALAQAIGPFIADFNETHVKNPRWPPHARFHNGQTMSMGLCLSLATLYYTHRPVLGKAAAVDSIFTAAVFGSLYWVTGLSAILYPGSKALDPEFGDKWFPQLPLFVSLLGLTWIGGWLEMAR